MISMCLPAKAPATGFSKVVYSSWARLRLNSETLPSRSSTSSASRLWCNAAILSWRALAPQGDALPFGCFARHSPDEPLLKINAHQKNNKSLVGTEKGLCVGNC